MRTRSKFAWSGTALTAKLFAPVLLSFVVGTIVFPAHDMPTTIWRLVIIGPALGSAVWLFASLGEIRPIKGGVIYRKWAKWRSIRSPEISDVVRVFPCFAALVLSDNSKLFFFPDAETKRILRSLSESISDRNNDVLHRTRTARLPGVFCLLTGVVLGLVICRPGRSPQRNYDSKPAALSTLETQYLPIFVAVSVTYLVILALAKRLSGRELYVSLALIGLGTVYVFCVNLRLV